MGGFVVGEQVCQGLQIELGRFEDAVPAADEVAADCAAGCSQLGGLSY
jgi:hypothetical protein